MLSRMFSSRSRKGLEFLGLQGKHNSSSHGTVPGFSADRPTSILHRISLQKSLIYGLGGSRGKKRKFGRAYLSREVRKDLSA